MAGYIYSQKTPPMISDVYFFFQYASKNKNL